jgi:hypothetical protein
MSWRTIPLALAGLALAFAGPALAEGRMQPGRWEITATVEVPGMADALPPTTQTECLSQADVDADPVPALERGICRATDVRRAGDKVTWKLECTGAIAGQGQGEIVQRSATAYDGWMTLDAGGVKMKTTLSGRRVGGC